MTERGREKTKARQRAGSSTVQPEPTVLEKGERWCSDPNLLSRGGPGLCKYKALCKWKRTSQI